MRRLIILFFCFILFGCTSSGENEVEKSRIIRQQFDSIDHSLDSVNNRIQKGVDSAIQKIDSLLRELDNKKK
jgi:flagellar hook-associated protein FlgK